MPGRRVVCPGHVLPLGLTFTDATEYGVEAGPAWRPVGPGAAEEGGPGGAAPPAPSAFLAARPAWTPQLGKGTDRRGGDKNMFGTQIGGEIGNF